MIAGIMLHAATHPVAAPRKPASTHPGARAFPLLAPSPLCYHSPTMPPRSPAAKKSQLTKKSATRRKKSARKPAAASAPSIAQLDRFLDKFTPEIAAQARVALRRMRARLPGAQELVYDNYNALAIGFSPTDRASDALFSIALYPRWVSLFFLQNGACLRDPDGYLEGSGNQCRHIKLKDPALLDSPGVQALIAQALELSPQPIDPGQPRRLIIKSISANQRPRRPTEK